MRLRLKERIDYTRLAAGHARRRAEGRLQLSRALRWRFGAPLAERLLIVPQELRTPDPSFWMELQQGQLGLAGLSVPIAGRHLFDVEAPGERWQQELHGFGWLRHLRGAGDSAAQAAAIQLVDDWIQRFRRQAGPLWRPEVAARRLVSWICNSDFVLSVSDAAAYDRLMESLADHVIHLSATWRSSAPGQATLLALCAIAIGHLTIDGHGDQLEPVMRNLADELDRQVLPDGGHVSRNGEALVEIVLELIPLRQSFVARGLVPPPCLADAIGRILAQLRWQRLGDGSLARFNGVGAGGRDALATVLAYDDERPSPAPPGSHSGYARIERCGTVVLMDAAPAPPLSHAAHAAAGCLSLEVSIGGEAVLINGGMPQAAPPAVELAARATKSHNTLSLGDQSSAEIIRHGGLGRLVGGQPIRGPSTVTAMHSSAPADQADVIEASHDGYLAHFGVLHRRRVEISADGSAIRCSDRIAPPRGQLRLKRDVPFVVHLHLAPGLDVTFDAPSRSAILHLHGADWRLTATGAEPRIEESTYFAHPTGPRRRLQIALRGATFGETEIVWQLERVA